MRAGCRRILGGKIRNVKCQARLGAGRQCFSAKAVPEKRPLPHVTVCQFRSGRLCALRSRNPSAPVKLEAHHIAALKGKRQLIQVNVRGTEMAEAATAARIEIIVSGYPDQWAAIRAAAPGLHLCLSLRHGDHADRASVLRAAFDALRVGGDSVYCPLSPASSNRSRAKVFPSVLMRDSCRNAPD